MKKNICIALIGITVIVAISGYFIFYQKNRSIFLKNGNNMSSQEIVDYILNISSYKAKITVDIKSNKNYNKYILNQEYISPNTNKQEVLEPENIAGVKLIKDENGLTVENTRLDLTSIFENYSYIENNCLDLSAFIEEYKKSEKSTCDEIEDKIIMKTQGSNDNKYIQHKILYIDKATCLPVRLEIKDDNQKTTVNILYNEVEIRN